MFGVTAAVELADTGFDVTLYDESDDILTGASGSNHWRLHRGYHYPQSEETASLAHDTEPLFRDRYADAVIEEENHYYAVAENSWVSPEEYIDFMDSQGLGYEKVNIDLVDEENIEQTFLVNENHVSLDRIRELCWDELNETDVSLRLGTHVKSLDELENYDYTVIATYSGINSLLPAEHELRQRFKFEICEVPVVQLPDRYTGNNIIVVYGPFMSTDHWGESDLFVMGDYHHMRHHSSTGYTPEIPSEYRDLINKGLINSPNVSNFSDFKVHGQKYIPGVADATHIGSLFTIRTLLPDVEKTDARPTLVNHAGDVMTIFGGKLATSVHTAKEVAELAEREWAPSRTPR